MGGGAQASLEAACRAAAPGSPGTQRSVHRFRRAVGLVRHRPATGPSGFGFARRAQAGLNNSIRKVGS
jgi:hypothetical protein